ncbi:hypothetical protein [Streptomyces roseochromogenus]|uniref:Uncharacterized protein n=1 Tax=Streptomyces roseochromogenus subsp. oscitans DS 12.976 TaxID=1352936 RepID=V6K5Z9_STRRC|nr:hypothetical protein [Streptomyces roseochromogenus]EST24389.1 hypothetical protein M878_30720 [Streptomyces roseochromogenus subsp. oscitans DS 12.976]
MSIYRENLPDGGWADLRDQAEVPERLRRPIRAIQIKLAKDPAFGSVVAEASKKGAAAVKGMAESEAAQMVAQMGDESAGLLDELNDRAIMARVVGWSYDAPVSMAALLDLPGPAYDRLKQLCAEGALQGTDFGPSQDEDSPTVPSTASA